MEDLSVNALLHPSLIALGLASTFAASSVAGARSTERWTLDDVVAKAVTQHPIIVASRERLNAAEGTYADAGKWENPRLIFSAENLQFGVDDFDFWTQPDWFLFVTQTIETAGKRGHRKRAAEMGVDLAELQQQIIERELVHRVKVAFQNVLTAQDKHALTRDSQSRLAELVELNRVRADEGYASEGDYIKARLEAQRFELALRKSELALQQSKIQLLQALGYMEFETQFELVAPEPLELMMAASVDEASLRDAAARRPEIRVADAVVARADARSQLEGALAHPDLAASLGYKRNGPANTLYLGMSLPLPILNRNQGGIVRGRAELALARAELMLEQSRVLAQLESALEGVRMTRRQIESLRADFIDRADESRTIALAAYTEGAADLLVVLEAERTRNVAQELVVDAVHDYRLALHELERAAGVKSLPSSSHVEGEAP
jgi:cobalt-zinc-cadmium efflux system outer membrane protein